MKKPVKYLLITLAWIIALTVVVWISLLIYVSLNEREYIARITSIMDKKTRGSSKIGGLSVSMLRTFPLMSLQLSDVVVRDSMYRRHRTDMFYAKNVYVGVNLPGLITGGSPVGRVLIQDGAANLLTDTTGYTNEYVLRSDSGAKDQKKNSEIPKIVLRNFLITYENPLKNKLHRSQINAMKCTVKDRGDNLQISVNTSMLVRGLGFNTTKGSYLREKTLKGDFTLAFDKKKKDLHVNRVKLNIDGSTFRFDGMFHIDKVSPDFYLDISTENIDFSKASSLMNDSIRKKTDLYSLTRPVSFNIRLSGKTLYKFIPLVKVQMEVTNNKVITPKGMFEECRFRAEFCNQLMPGVSRTDENSYVRIDGFSGRWENIQVISKSAQLSNITSPHLKCDLKADVDMESLNRLAGSSTLQFMEGKTSINIRFEGPISGRDSVVSNINGDVQISNAKIKYLPRNFTLSECNGIVRFINNDLVIPRLTTKAGKTKLEMSCKARNFLSLLNVDPAKLIMSWDVKSPALHLDDFRQFLSSSSARPTPEKKARFQAASDRVDQMFADGDVYISLQTPAMDYRNFSAEAVRARVVIRKSEIELEQAAFAHAGGSTEMSGVMRNGDEFNPVEFHAQLKRMDIPALFEAFNNFGQNAITYKNLNGKLTADVKYQAGITEKAELVTSAAEGEVHFLLENGELNNFEPIQEISRKVFRKQDFSQISFADLKNRLDITGNTFIVNSMEIRSTALNFFVEGIYDFKKGADMSITLPLKNLTKSQADTDLSDEARMKRGVSVRLRARTGDDGKLKLSWDPFKRALKNKEEVRDTIEPGN